MSVEITFEPAGLTGLVAEGTYVSDAARRMGVSMPVACGGPEKCTSCLVTIVTGVGLLSPLTEAELTMFGAAASFPQQRLACQVKIERSGELVVRVNPEKEKAEKPKDPAGVRKEFGELALDKKITTLLQLEALTMYEALNAIVEKPLAVGEKLFDRVFSKEKGIPDKNQSPDHE